MGQTERAQYQDAWLQEYSVQRGHTCWVKQNERASSVLIASKNPTPDKTGGILVWRRDIEVDRRQLFSLKSHLVRSADKFHILNLKFLALAIRPEQYKKFSALGPLQK